MAFNDSRAHLSVQIGRPEVLFSGRDIPARLSSIDYRANYDGSPDGQSFIVARILSQQEVVPILVENWWLEFDQE